VNPFSKRCVGCKQVKPRSAFPRIDSHQHSHSVYCTECSTKARNRRRREEGFWDYRKFVREQEQRERERMMSDPRTLEAFKRLRSHREEAQR
jgi:hypothetical protein